MYMYTINVILYGWFGLVLLCLTPLSTIVQVLYVYNYILYVRISQESAVLMTVL